MTERTIDKDNYIRVGGQFWFDKSKAKLLASYVANGNQKNELYELPSGAYVAYVHRYFSGGHFDDGYWSGEWKTLEPKDVEFSLFVEHMNPMPAKWILHRKELT